MTTAPRRRLDTELVRRGLVDDPALAEGVIADHRVRVDGAPATNPNRMVAAHEAITLIPPPSRYVSRGGEKLAAALARFDVDVTDRDAVDAGSSTGGFTDCLLQAGARTVTAVDVGRGQLHQSLRTDPRVTVRERTNLRHLDARDLDPRPSIVVADLSFISLRTVAPKLVELTATGGDLVLLVKPQFEARRDEVDAGRGVIDDPTIWRRTVEEVMAALREAEATIMGIMISPLRGAEGNVEFLLHARNGDPDLAAAPDPARLLDLAMAEAPTA